MNAGGNYIAQYKRCCGFSGVKPKTREKVLSAIRQLNYIPNEVARNFKMQKSTMVALLLPSIWHPFFSELAYYIEDELDREGFKLMLCNSGGKPEKELYYIDMLNQNKVAGIIGISYNDIDDSVSTDIPIISIDRHFAKKITCVTSDNRPFWTKRRSGHTVLNSLYTYVQNTI